MVDDWRSFEKYSSLKGETAKKGRKTSLLTLGQAWQQEKGQLLIAEVSKQMVGLSKKDTVSFFYVDIVFLTFLSNLKI